MFQIQEHYFRDEDSAYNCAAENNENDDEGWRYEAVCAGNFYKVAIYDEADEFVGYL